MNPTFVAIDIGASSGRLMKSTRDAKGSLILEEVHRFKNGFRNKDGHDRWKIDYLIKEILIGFEKLKQTGIDRLFAGIDTWAVDYCLIDEQGDRIN
ncbi:rhamnulokinase, partial [Enterococcus faecium]